MYGMNSMSEAEAYFTGLKTLAHLSAQAAVADTPEVIAAERANLTDWTVIKQPA